MSENPSEKQSPSEHSDDRLSEPLGQSQAQFSDAPPWQNFPQPQTQSQQSSARAITTDVSFREVVENSVSLLWKNLGRILLGWLIYIISLVVIGGVIYLVASLLLYAVLIGSTSTADVVFAIFLFIFLFLTLFGIFIFGLLTYISDLILFGSARYSQIFSGFSKKLAIAGFMLIAVLPGILLYIFFAMALGAMSFSRFISFFSLSAPLVSLVSGFIFAVYITKFAFVPNLLTAKNCTPIEAIKISWGAIRGKLFLTFFLLILAYSAAIILVNIIFAPWFASASRKALLYNTNKELIVAVITQFVVFQFLFLWILVAVAYTYNKVFYFDYLTQTTPLATPKKAQTFYAQANPDIFKVSDVPYVDVAEANASDDNSETSEPALFEGIKASANAAPSQDEPLDPYADYYLQEDEPDESAVDAENAEIPPAAHSFGVHHFDPPAAQNADYPTGKIVSIDALRMMKDEKVSFIQVEFEDDAQMTNIISQLDIFEYDETTGEYNIVEPLSFSVKAPKDENAPIKFFIGGLNFDPFLYSQARKVFINNSVKILKQHYYVED